MGAVGNVGAVRDKKQSMAELKLKRLNDLVVRLTDDLNRPRVRTSEASRLVVEYTKNTRDFMLPSVWGSVDKKDDPYNPQSSSSGCCSLM
ncbi:GGL domain-containing protein [Lipomyces japonicus]|uniref:GGL domain-containing protein n=1 Tax=Lipomyces japonicus TaxID=56871 RepID=UPI0034CF2EB3